MADTTPICRCRVLYLGSAVPRQSKDGLQGIQEPLRCLYPAQGAIGAKGIDSWLSVWSNGILLENVDENLKQITRFFPIESLHYCAAVRQVLIPERGNSNPEPKFLPLDSPFARMPRAQHPPIFAAILRRTTGIKVLECHVFICKREAAANALVRCCFHAYADNSYARQLETGTSENGATCSVYGTLSNTMDGSKSNDDLTNVGFMNGSKQQINGSPLTQSVWMRSRVGSTTTLNSFGRSINGYIPNGRTNEGNSSSIAAEGYTSVKNYCGSSANLNINLDDADMSFFNGDENHKVWNGSQNQLDSCGLESPYEVFSGNTSTLDRPARARQIRTPIEVPPPPVREEKRKNKKSTKSAESRSLSGTLIRPKPVTSSVLKQSSIYPGSPASVMYGPMSGVSGNPHNFRHYHTISHRNVPPAPSGISQKITHQHGLVPPHPHMLQSNHMAHFGMHGPVMMPQQFATLQPFYPTKKKKKDKKNNCIPVGMPLVPPLYTYQQPPSPHSQITQALINEPRALALSNRKLAASVGNGLDDSGNSGADSPLGTGIYKRKGHLNERAFSYSIRQEHRSRSHGSLASLQFNQPDKKKEYEIAQMVAGLNINDFDDHQTESTTLQRKQASNGYHQDQNKYQPHYGNRNSVKHYGNEIPRR